MKRVVRLRRCSLSVPGDSEKMLAKAQNINCDQIILDLEDSVAFESKARARHNISEAIGNKSFVAKTISARINATDTEHCHTDLIDLVSRAGKQLDTVILAKTRSRQTSSSSIRCYRNSKTNMAWEKKLGLNA